MPVRMQPGGLPLNLTSKSITFTGGAGAGAIGNVPLFTVTGQLIVTYILGIVTTSLTGATAIISLGTTTNTAEFIATTTATTMTTAAPIWMSATATAGSMAIPALVRDQVVAENIVMTVATAAVATGVLRIDCYWLPLGAGATVV